MQRYTFLEHTADARVLVEASSHEELFKCALHALTELQGATNYVGDELQFEVCCNARDTTKLLIDFLSYALTLSHIHTLIFDRVDIFFLDNNTIKATLFGRKAKHFQKDVKAVTYHEAEILKTESGTYQTMIIFDI